jgi:hypothetical protein
VYLVYTPEGSDEPQRWKYLPKKLMSAEREMLERRTGMNFTEFTQAVVKGNSVCRRALLFMYLKRSHPTTRYEDVDFAWDELTLEHSQGELLKMRETVADTTPPHLLEAVLEKLDAEIEAAFVDPDDEGKASLPIAV